MSSSAKLLYITSNGKVYKVPFQQSKQKWKPYKELANESVLLIRLTYYTKYRKPWTVDMIYYSREKLDNEGDLIFDEERCNYTHLVQGRASFPACIDDTPIPIPLAPVLPNEIERNALIEFIIDRYPDLWLNSPDIIDKSIEFALMIHYDIVHGLKKAAYFKGKRAQNV